MTTLQQRLRDPAVRRTYEEELLFGEAHDTLVGLLESLGISRTELAERLGVSPARVSQILSGRENLRLRTLASLGWALGIRFELHPVPVADRAGTPAVADSPPPTWLQKLHPTPEPKRRPVRLPTPTVSPRELPRRPAAGDGGIAA